MTQNHNRSLGFGATLGLALLVTAPVGAARSPVALGKYGGVTRCQFGYDALHRLTAARGEAESRLGVRDAFVAGYSYSDIHNLTRATLQREVRGGSGSSQGPNDARDEAYVYDAAKPHQAVRIGSTVLTYDAEGNTVTECEDVAGGCAAGKGRGYTWGDDGWLQEANKAGSVVRFLYDGEGQRLVKLGPGGASVTLGQWFSFKGNSHATKHVFAGTGRVATKLMPAAAAPPQGGGSAVGGGWPNSNGCIPSAAQPQKCPSSTGGPGTGVVAAVMRPATYYYHPDHLGSTQWLTDEEGRVHERVEYYPYGEVWREQHSGTNKLKQSFLYTGKEFDEETGLTYFGARYYDSRRARWLTTDPPTFRWRPTASFALRLPTSQPDSSHRPRRRETHRLREGWMDGPAAGGRTLRWAVAAARRSGPRLLHGHGCRDDGGRGL